MKNNTIKIILLSIIVVSIGILLFSSQFEIFKNTLKGKHVSTTYPAEQIQKSSSEEDKMSPWINNQIVCTLNYSEYPLKQYPYSDTGMDQVYTKDAFFDFCDKTNKLFTTSNLETDQANKLYEMILEKDIVHDGSYGMPSPDTEKPEQLTLNQLKERMAIKMVDESNFDIFYSEASCGVNYKYSTIFINTDSWDVKPIEEWSASSPC